MSGGKRNHEDLSDEMALLEAALKVYRGRTVAHSVPHKFRQRSRWRRARQRTKAPPVVHKPRAPRAQSCATRSRGVQMCVTEREMAGRNCNQCDSGREADGRRAKRRAKAPWVVHKPRAPRAQSCATRSRGSECVSPSERWQAATSVEEEKRLHNGHRARSSDGAIATRLVSPEFSQCSHADQTSDRADDSSCVVCPARPGASRATVARYAPS